MGDSETTRPSPELVQREQDIDDAQRSKDDPTLRSANEITGYHIHASDGEIGHVGDFLVEDDDWSIHYLIVDTTIWWPGKKVLISPRSVQNIEWANRLVNLGADRQMVKDSPAYDPSMTIDPLYEENILKHYGNLKSRDAR
jgi:hypothetical protein